MSSTMYSFTKSNPNQASAPGTASFFLAFGKCLGMLALLMLVLCASGAWAQVPTGAIHGTVVDPQGLPVEGATVTLTNQGTNYTYNSVTASSGGYQFERIDSGIYAVKVTKEGFRQGVVENIKLDAATTFSVPPIKLEVGAKTESVVVEGGAEIVNTTSTEVGGTVEKKQIDDLPILDRNVLALVGLEAGVNQNGATNTVISGQRTSFSNMTLDGINIQDNFIRDNALDFSPNLPFSSQAQEFTVTTQNADVENGNGASQVSIATPKGTNALHGEGFWYYRTNKWAANNWFNDASGVPLPNLLQNQGGGNIGGPIKKDKLFFYGYYELLRLRQQSPNNTTILSPTILSALSSATPTLPFKYQPYDLTTGAASGPQQTVDLLQIDTAAGGPAFTPDPAMLALLKRMPTTSNNTRVGDGLNLLGDQLNARSNQDQDNVGGRIDYNLNSKNTLSGTFSWNRQVVDRPDIDTSFDVVPLVQNNDKIKFLSTSWRFNPNATVTNEVRFGFDLAPAFFSTSQNFSPGFVLDNGSLPFTDPNPNFLQQGRNTRTWVGQDNASWSHGNHLLKFGFQFERITVFATNSAGIYPSYSLGFSNANDLTPNAAFFNAPANAQIAQSDYNNALAILSSVAGIISQETQTFNVTSQTSGYVNNASENRNYTDNQWAVYAGDSWKVNRKLTLNYGLRWEYFGPLNERNGLALLPVVQPGQTIEQTLLSNATVDFAGGPTPRPFYYPDYKDFAPNIGIAWDPFGNGKTAIRAGYSINHVNDSLFTAVSDATDLNSGLTTSPLYQGFPAGYTVSNPYVIPPPPFGIPVDFATNANIVGVGGNAGYGIDPNVRTPYVQQWNFSIQRDIGWKTSLSVSYVGNHGVGLLRAIDVNQVNINPNGFLAQFNQARQDGFNALAAGQAFDPLYGQAAGCGAFPAFSLLFACGGIDSHDPFNSQFYQPGFTNLIYQGQIGYLAYLYHAEEWDTGYNPGPGPNNPINFFANPYIVGGDLLENASSSSYNAGIVELRRRLNSGLYFQVNYVYSKVLTDYGGSQQNFQPFLDNARPRLDRQRAPFDLTHAVKANFTYEVPIGKGHRMLSSNNKALGLLVDGWQTGSVITWQTGAPFSINTGEFASFNRSGLRSYNNEAVATLSHQQISNLLGVYKQGGGVVYGISPTLISPNGTGAPASPQLSCVPAVTGGFCDPQPGQVGNLQVDAFSGPSYFDWDISASKDFNLTERFKLTFRTEAFNVFNHPVFFMGDQNINSTTFGQSTSTISTPRILQMSLRLKF